jgi:hypothetical protein
MQEADFERQCLFRELYTNPEVIAADHHKKRFYGSESNVEGSVPNRLTVWDNALNMPVLALNTHTTSFDENTVVEGCKAVKDVIKSNGGKGPQVAYSDMPQRDGNGFVRLFNSLTRRICPTDMAPFGFWGEIKYVTELPGVAPAITALSQQKVLGLDLEFYAPMTRGQSNHPTALIQLSTGDSPGICCVFDVHKLGCLPVELRRIICCSDIMKVGINIAGDATKLGNDFGVDVKQGLMASCRDIGSLANTLLPSLTTQIGKRRWNLEDLVKEVCDLMSDLNGYVDVLLR